MGLFSKLGTGIGAYAGGLMGGIYGGATGGAMGQRFQDSWFPGDGDGSGGGAAGYPSYVGMDVNGNDMNIAGQFNGPNAPLDKFAQESMRNGRSRSTEFALQQNALGANEGRDQARKIAAGMGKDAMANLSMKGGLGAGASERINKYATNVGMEGAQAADANAGQNRAGLMIADENARTGNLAQASGLIGQDKQMRYNMMAGDMARKQGELDRRNAFTMNHYNQQMAAWGAGKQADATAHSGKKG